MSKITIDNVVYSSTSECCDDRQLDIVEVIEHRELLNITTEDAINHLINKRSLTMMEHKFLYTRFAQ